MSYRVLVLFLPLLPAYLFSGDPILSYSIAWLGSVFLLVASLVGWIVPLPDDVPFAQQIMRPIIIIQVIFVGFNFITSIFYFLDTLGMRDFIWTNAVTDDDRLTLLAECQRYYLLGHIFFLLGIYVKGFKLKTEFFLTTTNITFFLLVFSGVTLVANLISSTIAGFQQISEQFRNLNFLCCTAAFCYAITSKNNKYIIFGFLFYAITFSQAIISGFKEPIIISLLLTGIYLYPYYKKIILISVLPFLYISFVFIPAYIGNFRYLRGDEDLNSNVEDIRDKALQDALNEHQSNWAFLTGRLSEVGMFTQYVRSTPDVVPYYEFQTIEQSIISLIPRAFWSGKPVTENLVMERAYFAGVIDVSSSVSAKPGYIIDGYLAYGWIGIIISMFIIGYATQFISIKAEQWFGGYFLGTSIIFNGLFFILWKGLSFEFILNSVLYAFLTMYLIRLIFQKIGILVKHA